MERSASLIPKDKHRRIAIRQHSLMSTIFKASNFVKSTTDLLKTGDTSSLYLTP